MTKHELFNNNKTITLNVNVVSDSFLAKSEAYPGPNQTFLIDFSFENNEYDVTLF